MRPTKSGGSAQRRFPLNHYRCNLIVPGFPKCGTTSLHAYLNLHDQVCMSRSKEPQIFGRADRMATAPVTHNALFEGKPDARYFGESSTTYSINTEALRDIKANLRDPRIIIVLRHPVARTLSHYKWLCAQGLEHRSLPDALQADGFGFDPYKSINGNYKAYLQFSSYSKYVPMWESEFGGENVHLVATEALAKDPDGTLAQVWRFLGLAPRRVEEVVEVNATRDVQDKGLPGWMRQAGKVLPPGLKRSAIVTKAKSLFQTNVAVEPRYTEQDLARLAEMLAAEVAFYESRLARPDQRVAALTAAS